MRKAEWKSWYWVQHSREHGASSFVETTVDRSSFVETTVDRSSFVETTVDRSSFVSRK